MWSREKKAQLMGLLLRKLEVLGSAVGTPGMRDQLDLLGG